MKYSFLITLLLLKVADISAQEEESAGIRCQYDHTFEKKSVVNLFIYDNSSVWLDSLTISTDTSKYVNTKDNGALFPSAAKVLPGGIWIRRDMTSGVFISKEAYYGGFAYVDESSVSEIAWILLNDTTVVNGIGCKKAKAKFRGVEWVAWYAPSIPIPTGPWKLWGLPGLIVEAKATDGTHTFTLTKLQSNYTLPALGQFIPEIPTITRDEYWKVFEKSYKDRQAIMQLRVDEVSASSGKKGGVEIEISPPSEGTTLERAKN